MRRLLCGLQGLVVPVGMAAGAASAAQPSALQPEIVIYGQRPGIDATSGLRADGEIDENGIAAYGADTVGDLLGALATDLDASGEGPVVLINGELTNGLTDITDLPTEAVSRIQILSRSAATTLGQRSTRRVLNVVIRPNHRQATLNAKGRLATAGDGGQREGEVNLLKLHNGNRRSLVVRAIESDRLFESDRGISSQAGDVPFDPAGNILAYPSIGDEIDPALSLLAGQVVTVAGVPVANPTLADFADVANVAHRSNLGRLRTLLPALSGGAVNANVTQPIGPSTLSLTLRGERQETRSRTGAATASLVVPGSSPFSPFERDVTLATIVGRAQRQKADFTILSGGAVLNGPLGTWRYSVNANGNRRTSHTVSERGYDLDPLQDAISAGTLNPFSFDATGLIGQPALERARGRITTGGVQATLNGSPFRLPAGAVRAAALLEWRIARGSSRTRPATTVVRNLRRDDLVSQLSLQVPIIASPQIGSVGVEVSGALRHVTGSGWLHDRGSAINWERSRRFSMRAAINREELAPPPNALSDPVATLENVRTFDFIRQETVLVRYRTGGNPDLDVERRRTASLGLTWRPFETYDVSVTADLARVRGRGAFAALPPVNADVQAAFPDRFVRDGDGRLILVDARPVPFALVKRDELRLGLTFNRTFGSSGLGASPAGNPAEGAGAGWRVNAFVTDAWILQSKRQARAALPVIDLLDGGALGYGGGQPRHRVQFGGGIVHRGIGLQTDGSFTSSSRIAAGTMANPDELRFSARTLVDVRMFANLGPLMPERPWAKGMRLSLGVDNAFDSKLRVRDRSGTTPIGYQPYLLDPLGRTITLALRKAF